MISTERHHHIVFHPFLCSSHLVFAPNVVALFVRDLKQFLFTFMLHSQPTTSLTQQPLKPLSQSFEPECGISF